MQIKQDLSAYCHKKMYVQVQDGLTASSLSVYY